MGLQEIPPRTVTKLDGLLGRTDDVGEQDRCERTVGNDRCGQSSQELLDLAEGTVSARFHERERVGSGKGREPRSGNVLSEVTRAFKAR